MSAAEAETESASPEQPEASESEGPRQNPWVAAGVSVLSGCLWFLACADFDIWPLAWVAMIPSLWVIDNAPTRRRALFYGWITGLVANLGGFYWIANLLERFAHMPYAVGLLGLLMLASYQALVFLLFAWAIRSIRTTSADTLGAPLPMALLAPIVMISFELLVPFMFPWFLAITQAWVVPVIQIAEITGPLGVTALLLAINGGIYDALFERTRVRRFVPLAGAVGFLAVALLFGVVRTGQIDDRRAQAPGVMVGVVQGNIGFDEKGRHRREQLRAQQLHTAALEAGDVPGVDRFGEPLTGERGADLVLWSESSYPYSLQRWLTDPQKRETDLPEGDRRRVRRGFTVPLIFGAITRHFDNPADYPWNSALMLDREGTFVGRFDKIFLLVFGEYVPFLETFEFVKNLAPQASSHFHRGEQIVTFPFEHAGQTWRLGPMICYEDILPDLGRKLADHHPHLLVNLTNDAWFGDSAEPWEHLALSVYRAVEMRTDLVRAVNTGVSAFIDANGRVYHESYAMDPGILEHGSCAANDGCPGGYLCRDATCVRRGADAILAETVLMGGADGGGYTFYARFGDVFGYLNVLALLGLGLVWPRLTRRQNRD